MDDIIEGAFKGLLRVLYFIVRAMVWLIWDLWVEIIGWYVGWPIVRVVTLNQFPSEGINEHSKASILTDFIVCIVGFISLVCLAAVLAHLIGVL
ncbi:MAG: hypothetical protein JKX76_03555 [Colwellia sp.]|nr:hypothetical protein [Colwellia sp.]